MCERSEHIISTGFGEAPCAEPAIGDRSGRIATSSDATCGDTDG
jgi:hypothetical protein